MSSCSHKLNKYNLNSDYPRIILVDDMLNDIDMYQSIETSKMPSIEFWDKEGNRRYGKLIKISKYSIEYSIGYYYKSENDSVKMIEKIESIPKDRVVIFKMW